jgi:hypothetical protein
MRLTDLDQTVIFTITDETQGGMQYEMQMTVAEVFDKFFDGVQPEIIDAIPVEWLRKKRVTHPTTDAEILHNSVIRAVLVMWEREQEAR